MTPPEPNNYIYLKSDLKARRRAVEKHFESEDMTNTPNTTPAMGTLQDASRFLAKQSVAIEDSAVSEYIRQQAEYLKAKGENLADYYLVREDGNLTYDGGTTIKHSVYYGLKHKDTVKRIELTDEDK